MTGWLALHDDGRLVVDQYGAAVLFATRDRAADHGAPCATTPEAHPTTAYRRGVPT